MTRNRRSWDKYIESVREFFNEPITFYTLAISLIISLFIVLEAVYPRFVIGMSSIGIFWFQEHYPIFATSDDRLFSQNFVEWFGVFYGFLMPLLLVRAWEQLDRADREFDREADAIKMLLGDVLLLDNTFLGLKKTMVGELKAYIQHVLSSYKVEHQDSHIELRNTGDAILQGIRINYKELIYGGGS